MAAQDRLLTLGKNLLFLSHPSAKLGKNYPSIVNGPSTGVKIKIMSGNPITDFNISLFGFGSTSWVHCHNVILYPDLTLSYAGK